MTNIDLIPFSYWNNIGFIMDGSIHIFDIYIYVINNNFIFMMNFYDFILDYRCC